MKILNYLRSSIRYGLCHSGLRFERLGHRRHDRVLDRDRHWVAILGGYRRSKSRGHRHRFRGGIRRRYRRIDRRVGRRRRAR